MGQFPGIKSVSYTHLDVYKRQGLEEILILVGESRNMSNVEYIGNAVKMAKKYFKVIGLEVYPMNSDEYAYLHLSLIHI